MKLRYLFLALTSILAGGCTEPRDPVEILELASAATASVPAVAYDYEFQKFERTDLKSDDALRQRRLVVSGKGSILLERATDARNYRVRGDWSDGWTIVVSDGETVARLDRGEKTVSSGSIFAAGAALRARAARNVMQVYLDASPFRDELAASVVWEGVRRVGGVKCDVVRVDHPDDDIDSRWYVDVETHLPLRFERISDEYSEQLSLSNLRVDPERSPSDFILETPEGYTEVPYELGLSPGTVVPDWTLSQPDGAEVSSKQLLGQIVVIDFGAPDCPAGRESMSALEQLREDFSDDPVSILGVQIVDDDGSDCWGRHEPVEKNPLQIDPFVEGEELLESIIGRRTVRSFVVIDHEGRVIGTGADYFGKRSDAYLRSLIVEGLARLVSTES